MTRTVLVIDDVEIASKIEPHLLRRGYAVEQIRTTEGAVDVVAQLQPDIILLDLHFEGDELKGHRTTGGAFHTVLREQFPDIPVLIFSTRMADNTIPEEEFEIKPLARIAKPDLIAGDWAETLAKRLDKAIAQHGQSAEDYSLILGFPIGKTALMREFARRLAIVAPTDQNVVVRGEAGTGKELAARGIHQASGRTGQFVVARLAALPPELAAAALSGQGMGGTSAAVGGSNGLFAAAAEGTLYFDEIGDLPADAQAALTAFLAGQADVRIIAATQFDLDGLVAAGLLRQDLKDRLAEADLYLPPLRQRTSDIPELFRQAVEEFNATAEIPVSLQLRPETLACLEGYAWPGNIREFRNVLNAALLLTSNEILMPDDIRFEAVATAVPLAIVDERGSEAEVAPIGLSSNNLAEWYFQQIDNAEQGDPKYKKYIKMDKDLIKSVTTLIFEKIRRDNNGQAPFRRDIAMYFYGNAHTEKEWERVRGFISKNSAWPKAE